MSTITWHKITDHINTIPWQTNDMCVVEVDGKKISLAKKDDKLFGFAHKCPHAGGIMADGFLDAIGNVVCPLHRYKFNIQNGRNTTGEGYYLKTFAVEQREDGIYVCFEKKSLFGW